MYLKSCTQNPKPVIVHSKQMKELSEAWRTQKPETLYPKSCTRNSVPETLYPNPCTRNSPPEILYPKPNSGSETQIEELRSEKRNAREALDALLLEQVFVALGFASE